MGLDAGAFGAAGLAFATLLSVAFFSMARLSSLVPTSPNTADSTRHPSFADVGVEGDRVTLRIKWAKCHQRAEQGFTVPLLKMEASPACPVDLLASLTHLVRGAPNTTPLFSYPLAQSGLRRGYRSLCTGGGGGGGGRRQLQALLLRLGLAGEGYTFHSLRRGACSRAYEQGASIPDLQFMGGWRGDSVQLYLPAAAARDRAASFLHSHGPLRTTWPLNYLGLKFYFAATVGLGLCGGFHL